MASDYRGQPENPTESNARPYSQVVELIQYPKKEQAIVLNVNENLKLTDYVTAIGNIVMPKNIIFASRISNNRICIYLSNTNLVDTLTGQYKSMLINNHEVGIRKLISPSKRLIMSNVCPSIPNELLQTALLSLGYKLVSPIAFLKAGIMGSEYSHIKSFRRQVYISPDDSIQLPSSIVITHEEISYRIFLTFDSLQCFLCKSSGHLAMNCPQNNTNTIADAQNSQIMPCNTDYSVTENAANNIVSSADNILLAEAIDEPDKGTNFIPREIQHNPEITITEATTANVIKGTPSKRPPSITLSQLNESFDSSSSLQATPQDEKSNFATPNPKIMLQTKKLKHSKSIDLNIKELLNPLSEMISEASPPYVLNLQQLEDFLENVSGSPDPLSVAQYYTNDTTELLRLLHDIYPKTDNRCLKNRLTRIQKKIKRNLLEASDEFQMYISDTDCSISSQKSNP